MSDLPLLEPKNVTIEGVDGKERSFIISKFPAIQGREIMEQYPYANAPKFGNYPLAQELSLKMMCFVAVDIGSGVIQKLNLPLLVDQHVGDWITIKKIEDAMIAYNGGFFQSGWISAFLEESIRKHLPKILKTLMVSLAQLSQAEKQV